MGPEAARLSWENGEKEKVVCADTRGPGGLSRPAHEGGLMLERGGPCMPRVVGIA